MERMKIIGLIFAFICVRCGHPLTIEELSPLLETLKAGIRTEILSEVKSITAELSNNVIATEEIVSVVQNQEDVIKALTKELDETKILLRNNADQLETTINQLEVAIGNQSYQFNEFQSELKGIQENQENVKFVTANHSETLHGLALDIEQYEKNQNENQAIIKNHTEQLSGLKIDVEGLRTGQSQIDGLIEEHSNSIGNVRLEQNKTLVILNENSSGLDDLEAHFDELKEGEL